MPSNDRLPPYIHATADVASPHIKSRTRVWQFVVVLEEARIGSDCNICSHCFIENDVIIGDRVTIKNNVSVWDGLRIADDCFIGPNVSFTNDRFPRSKKYLGKFHTTNVKKGASLGAGSVILPGLTIGQNAMVGAGAVVLESVPDNAIVAGNPARIVGYIDAEKHENRTEGVVDVFARTVQPQVRGVKLIELPEFTDIRGSLIAGEFERSIPFPVKRYFIVFDVPSEQTRGQHAHYQCEQFLICIRGRCSVVADDGVRREEYELDRPSLGLYLPPMTWGIQYKYSRDAVLLVLASRYYESDDYIRDYEEFSALIGSQT